MQSFWARTLFNFTMHVCIQHRQSRAECASSLHFSSVVLALNTVLASHTGCSLRPIVASSPVAWLIATTAFDKSFAHRSQQCVASICIDTFGRQFRSALIFHNDLTAKLELSLPHWLQKWSEVVAFWSPLQASFLRQVRGRPSLVEIFPQYCANACTLGGIHTTDEEACGGGRICAVNTASLDGPAWCGRTKAALKRHMSRHPSSRSPTAPPNVKAHFSCGRTCHFHTCRPHSVEKATLAT